MRAREGKNEEKELKGACNCSQGCIAEVEREGPRGGHEGGKRTALYARYIDRESRRETRAYIYMCMCVHVRCKCECLRV